MEVRGVYLKTMNLFSGDSSSSVALAQLKSAGLETFGNNDIIKTLLFFFEKGLNHHGNRAYDKYLSVLQQFEDIDMRDMLIGNVIEPVARYVDTNPSSNNFTTFVADLYPECRKFVLDFPEVFTNLEDAIVLCNNHFFESMSNAAMVLMIDCYGVDELKEYNFTPVSSSIEILLHQCLKFSLKEPLESLLELSNMLTIEQAEVLEMFCEVGGFTLEDIEDASKFDQQKLFKVFSKVYTLARSEVLLKEEIYFLIYFLYSKYALEDFTEDFDVTGNPFVRALLQKYVSRPFGDSIRQLFYASSEKMFKCQSIEFVLDGSSVLLLPFDAALYPDAEKAVDEIFSKAVMVWGEYLECFNVELCNSNRKVSKLVIYAYSTFDSINSTLGRRAFWLDTGVYGFDNYEDEWDDESSMLSLLFDNFSLGRPLTNIKLEGLGVVRADHFLDEKVGTQVALLIGAIAKSDKHPGYDLLLSRNDFGLPLFHVLQNMVSPLDSLYAALLRYHLAIIKVPFRYFNKTFNLDTPIISVNSVDYNVLGILNGNKELLNALKEYVVVADTNGVVLLEN